MIDLHTHSTYSDGTVPPAGIIELAEQGGLTAVALCDHNTVAGLPEFLAAAQGKLVKAVAGVEISTDYGDRELHILGLFLRPEQYRPIADYLDELLRRKEQSNRDLVARLCEAGFDLDYERIRASTADGFVNRAVIAAEMTRLGYAASVKQAFSEWLSPKLGYYYPPRRPDVFETIRFLKKLGVLTLLAHPFLNLDEVQLRKFLTNAVPCGLDGMETRYSKYDAETSVLAQQIAEEFDLLESGGSDFHGDNKPDTQLGCGRGELVVPDAFLEAMKDRKNLELT